MKNNVISTDKLNSTNVKFGLISKTLLRIEYYESEDTRHSLAFNSREDALYVANMVDKTVSKKELEHIHCKNFKQELLYYLIRFNNLYRGCKDLFNAKTAHLDSELKLDDSTITRAKANAILVEFLIAYLDYLVIYHPDNSALHRIIEQRITSIDGAKFEDSSTLYTYVNSYKNGRVLCNIPLLTEARTINRRVCDTLGLIANKVEDNGKVNLELAYKYIQEHCIKMLDTDLARIGTDKPVCALNTYAVNLFRYSIRQKVVTSTFSNPSPLMAKSKVLGIGNEVSHNTDANLDYDLRVVYNTTKNIVELACEHEIVIVGNTISAYGSFTM